jgi:hypothetical protein
VCAPFGIGIRANDSGELEPFDARLGQSNTLPLVTITDADVVDGSTRGSPSSWIPRRRCRRSPSDTSGSLISGPCPIGEKGSFVDAVVEQDEEFTLINGDTSAVPFGQFDLTTDGYPQASLAKYPTAQASCTAIARRLFDRFGHGAIAVETTFLRGGAGETVKLGDEVIVALSQLPNQNYRLGDNLAIAGRAMQVVRRTVTPIGYEVRLVDSGPNAAPLGTVPTLTIAGSADLPRTVAEVTITNAATLNGLGLRGAAAVGAEQHRRGAGELAVRRRLRVESRRDSHRRDPPAAGRSGRHDLRARAQRRRGDVAAVELRRHGASHVVGDRESFGCDGDAGDG